MRLITCLAATALAAATPAALAGVLTPDCASGGCIVTADAAAWAQVATGVQAGLVAYPRSTRGAMLRDVRLTTQQPRDGDRLTVCDGRQQATGRYSWMGKSVTFINVTVPGVAVGDQQCTSGDPARFECTTRTISGLGRARDCTSANWRILIWGRYEPQVGGQFQLSGPRKFPVEAVARSVR